jgi:hypothetical protein
MAGQEQRLTQLSGWSRWKSAEKAVLQVSEPLVSLPGHLQRTLNVARRPGNESSKAAELI